MVWHKRFFDSHITSLAFLHEIKDAFGGELRFRVEMHNGKISGRFADLLIKRGEDAGKTFTYEKDLVGVRRIADRSTVFTALIGVGKGNETGLTLNFSNEVRSKASGDAFDKPAGQDWVGDPESLQRWGHRDKNGNLKHLFGTFEYDTDQPGVLLDRTWEKLQEIKNGVMNYEVLVALLENVEGYEHEKIRIGDTVLVQDLSFKPALMLKARVLEMTRSFTNPENDKVVLGQFLPAVSNADENIKMLQSVLLKKEKEWERVPGANEITYTDGNTVESLKPAQAGADVTGDNTAKNTENVGSTPAATIEQNANNAIQKGVAYTNGWNFDDANGVTITRSDNLVRVVESATDGIKIQRRDDVLSAWQDVFFVDTLGKLQIAGDLVGGSSIDVSTDVKVGQNVYLQHAFEDRVNEKGVIFYDPALGGGFDTRIVGTYLKLDIICNNLISLYTSIFDVYASTLRLQGDTQLFINSKQPKQSVPEQGFCGVGGMDSAGITTAVAGTGVNFKVKKPIHLHQSHFQQHQAMHRLQR
ncbi:phage tail spike protein [Cytobacillus firmus]|uniref:phage tail spike protein n=1 Tax=Cytobacillus firmus TaxID=1399 RepID=UPI00202E913F|nr:phage tail spike protein [Cytobacillus firmus]URT72349.1 phage tail protein [Cytobacillus firmus]